VSKIDISAVLTVKSGLNSLMINKLKDEFKSLLWLFLMALLSTISVFTLANCCSKEEGVKSAENDAEF
jgi:hypothetical protein